MSHGFGEVEAIQAILPDLVITLAAILTQLGDTWLVFVVLVSVYLLADRLPVVGAGLDRSDAVFLYAVGLAGVGLTIGAKAAFGHPRPPSAEFVSGGAGLPAALRGIYASLATAEGFGLPSGHAVSSTVLYGGLALVLNRWTLRGRAAVATVVVTVIGATRVVLGVHYLGDVLLGVILGGALLGMMALFARDRPQRVLGGSVALALVVVVMAGYTFDSMAVLGASIGSGITWAIVGDAVPATPVNDRETRLLALVGLPVAVALFGLTVGLESIGQAWAAAPAGGFIRAGFAAGVFLTIPVITNGFVGSGVAGSGQTPGP